MAIVLGVLFGGSPLALIDTVSVFVVLLGTVGATIICFPLARMLKFHTVVMKAFFNTPTDMVEIILDLVKYAELARREGILSLENMVDEMKDPFIVRGIKMAVDGTDPELIKEVMDTELEALMNRHADGKQILDSIAKYAPAFGMIGTLLGLIFMLQSMTDPSSIGPSMAVALITTLYGAMLAGVTYILMGAGIPKAIPGILDQFARGQAAELRLDVAGAEPGEVFTNTFDPTEFHEGPAPKLARPGFLAIVSSPTLANMLARKSSGKVDGFIIEGPTAGGHNAPPRGKIQLSVAGEPIYGERDKCNLEAVKEIGLPFWLAGSYAEPHRIEEAIKAGAAGVQIGTAFAYCEESGIEPGWKAQVLQMSQRGEAKIFTDPRASPTGFPFKIVELDETISDQATYEKRTRICDLSYLRHAYKTPAGKVGWRCPSEPVDDYLRKGGDEADTVGRKCVCNGLMANIGLGQTQRNGEVELPLITSGDDVADVARFLKPGAQTYTAADVIDYLLSDIADARPGETQARASS